MSIYNEDFYDGDFGDFIDYQQFEIVADAYPPDVNSYFEGIFVRDESGPFTLYEVNEEYGHVKEIAKYRRSDKSEYDEIVKNVLKNLVLFEAYDTSIYDTSVCDYIEECLIGGGDYWIADLSEKNVRIARLTILNW